MVCPLLQGISNYIHPYVDLNSVDLLEDPVYIAGVINPIFRQSKKFQELYDILIPIDKGQSNGKPILGSIPERLVGRPIGDEDSQGADSSD